MNLIIAGCGRVGSELAHTLAKKGHNVIVIDRNPQAFQRLEHDFRGRTVQGDVRDREVLTRAAIENANGFAILTPNDELNIVAALAAQDLFKVPNVVTRVYDPVHAKVFERAGLQTVIPSSWSAHRVEQLLTHPGIIELASIGNGDVLLVEIAIPEHMVDMPIPELAQACDCQPTAFVRGGQTSLTSPEVRLEKGDLVVLAIASSNLTQLENLLGPKEV